MEVLEQNLAAVDGFVPLSDEERRDLLARTAPAAVNGAFERFKTRRDFDANEGRVAHSYPLQGEAAD
jgi:hypothetical protein